MNRMARITAIATRVAAAFLASGGLNAGTPVAIASVPVRATAPAANARSRSSTLTVWAVFTTAAWASGGGGCAFAEHDDPVGAERRSSAGR